MSSESATDHASRQTWALLLATTLLGATLRLYQLGDYSLWYDEAASILMPQYLDGAFSIFDARYFIEAPLMAVLASQWNLIIESLFALPRISETHDFLARLLSAIPGIINIPLIYMVSKHFFQKNTPALLAAALFAISPFHLYYAQELRIYSILTSAGLLAMLCFQFAVVHNRIPAWIGLSATFSLLLYSHLISFWYIVAFNIAYVIGYLPRYGRLARWTAANAGALLLSAPVLGLGLAAKDVIDQISISWHFHATPKTGLITFKDFFFGYAPASWAYWPLFIVTGLLFIAGILSLRRNYSLAVLLLVMTAFPIAANILAWSNKSFSFYEHRTFIISGACAIIAVAAGLASLPGQIIRWAVLSLIALLTVPALAGYYSQNLHPVEEHRIGVWEKVDFRSAASLVMEKWEEGDILAYGAIHPMFPVRYYLHDAKSVRVTVLPDEVAHTYQAVGSKSLADNFKMPPQMLPDALNGARRVWFIHADGIAFVWKDGADQALAWLKENWKEAGTWRFEGLQLFLFENVAEQGGPSR